VLYLDFEIVGRHAYRLAIAAEQYVREYGQNGFVVCRSDNSLNCVQQFLSVDDEFHARSV
jgi:hypothetical protein